MLFRIVLRSSSAKLAIAAIALGVASTLSQPLGAQISKYDSPYGSYGGPYKRYKQYDPYDDYSKPPSSEDRGDMVPFKRSGGPLLAVVGLDTQRVSIYNSAGRMILQSPVSTGTTGYETPAGIFSVVQKKADHNSNLYEDGNMPFMQRITWSGIAMHAGALPGHPASHGCVRLPIDIAQRLFDLTDVGMRVLIVPNEITLAEFDHPHLLKSNVARLELSSPPTNTASRTAADPLQMLRSIASSKASEAETVQRKASEVRRIATRKSADAASAAKALQAAEASHARADAQLKDAAKALEAINTAATSSTPEAIKRAETAKEKAAVRLAEADAQLETAKARAQANTDAATAAEDQAKAAEDASDAAQDAATEAKRRILPISVFVSRKTQRFYVRQGYVPVFEGPITIRDAEKPVGTYVFTAFGNANERVRWGLVSMYADGNSKVTAEPAAVRSPSRKGEARRSIEASPADVVGAKSALDRIAIPQEALHRISDLVLPGSSLIVSDEGLSIETGKDTDFVIVMSGEPQGALKVRQREPPRVDSWGGPYGGYGRAPFGRGGFWKW
jgi:L,D-transpeptidase-like protein